VGAWITTHTITHLAEINEVTLRAMKLRKGVSAQTRINDMAAVSSFLGYLEPVPTSQLIGYDIVA